MLVLTLGAIAFAVFQPVQVLPRIRLGPGYALIDQDGARLTSEDGRGVITLVSFASLDCGTTCDDVAETMREVRERVDADVDLGGTDFRLLTFVLDPSPAPERVAAARTAAGADWEWAAGTEAQIENVVGLGFRRSTASIDTRPGYAIVDGWGVIRGEYQYQTLADDADKLVRHIDILGSELRNDSGFGSFVYGAAHAFQCYP